MRKERLNFFNGAGQWCYTPFIPALGRGGIYELQPGSGKPGLYKEALFQKKKSSNKILYAVIIQVHHKELLQMKA